MKTWGGISVFVVEFLFSSKDLLLSQSFPYQNGTTITQLLKPKLQEWS
jgi:hypothetical protein